MQDQDVDCRHTKLKAKNCQRIHTVQNTGTFRIARNIFRTILTKQQSPLQRGFTTNTSPLNATVVSEEVYREYSDRKAPFYSALLDAKSVFDVVDIDILMRKLFLLGVQPST